MLVLRDMTNGKSSAAALTLTLSQRERLDQAEQPAGVGRGGGRQLPDGRAPQLGQKRRRMDHVGRLVPPLAVPRKTCGTRYGLSVSTSKRSSGTSRATARSGSNFLFE